MGDKVSSIIDNALIASKSIVLDEKSLVIKYALAIKNNLKAIQLANSNDLNSNIGFKLDYKIIEKLLNKYIKEESLISSDEDLIITDNNLINSSVYSKLGIVLVSFDGNTYTLLELILLGLLTHNTIIFAYDNYMHNTNDVFIKIAQLVLNKADLSSYMFQHDYSNSLFEYFKNSSSIDKTIIIGNGEFISTNLEKCTTEVSTYGYNYYDLYIESTKRIEDIKKILDTNKDIKLYVKKGVEFDYRKDYITVEGIVDAIYNINKKGSLYSSAVFTENRDSIFSFINDINSKNIMINSSPILEDSLGITQQDLLRKKNVIIPNIYSIMDHE